MKTTFILILFFGVVISSCNNNSNNNNGTEKNITQTELQPIEVVKLFINSLGSKDFKTAYNLQKVGSWGDYQQFSSTKAFGGINATAINKIKEIEVNSKNAKIYVDAYYYDPVNGNNRFQQYFYLTKIGDEWKIEKLEQTINSTKKLEEEINKILSNYSFFGNSIDQSKNKNTFYSYSLPNSNKLYVVFTSNEDIGGHFCYTYMSIFIFNVTNNILNKFIKSVKVPSNFGSYPPEKENVKLYTFDDKFMISIDWGYIQMGIMEDFTTFYYILKNRLTEIGEIKTHFDNLGMYSWKDKEVDKWDGEIKFLNTKTNSLPDIELHYVESTYYDSDAMKAKYYYFNGSKYIEK